MKTIGKQLEVPFHRSAVGEAEAQAVADVVRSGWLTMGPKTIEFEREFANYVGTEHAIAVNSCTAALHLALEAIGINAGDEVLVPTTTFTATGEVVAYFDAKPVLVDVCKDTLNIDPEDAARRVTPRTKAIIPVHFAGQPCDMHELLELAKGCNLHVIEDAAHSLPASYRGNKIGSVSEMTAFSFYATKTITTGEGGMITTNNGELAERMRIMRLHGISRDAWKRYSSEGSWYYEVIEAGFKYNLTDLQAALGLVQLPKCDLFQEQRAGIARLYTESFREMPAFDLPTVKADRQSAWHLYVLRLRTERLRISRDKFIEELRERKIGTSVHFIPLHLHPYYQRTFGYRAGAFPVAESEYARSLSLPIYPDMTREETQAVIDAVSEIAEEHRI